MECELGLQKEPNGKGRSSKRRYSEEEVEAAWTLIHMSEQLLDADTAKQLRIQREKTQKHRPTPDRDDDRHENPHSFVLPQETVDRLPRFPPTEGLTVIMEHCSQPFDKELTSSDLNTHLCKLTLTRKKVTDLFLPMLRPSDGDVAEGIPVNTYDWSGKSSAMTFKSWNENKLYVLTTGWTDFCNGRGGTMEVRDRVIVWMFRHSVTKRICFALSLVKCNKENRLSD